MNIEVSSEMPRARRSSRNVGTAPVTRILNLKGSYRDVFKDSVVTPPVELSFSPGEFMVLTKIVE